MAKEPDIVAKCIQDFEEDLKSHDPFREKVEERYRAYRGILEIRSEANDWTNKQAPPYILQIIETMVAGLMDPTPKHRVRARPRMDTPDMVELYRQGAKSLELLLGYQLDRDHFADKQRSHRLQALIAGLSVRKSYWLYKEGEVTRNVTIGDEFGLPRTEKQTFREVSLDDPTSDVIDVRDFVWHQAATSLDTAIRITHRTWETYDHLLELQAAGIYNNVESLKESQDQTQGAGLYTREADLFSAERTKDLIEVLECWIEGGKRVVSIGNRSVLLRDRPNPFWHNSYPFDVVSSMPDLFRIPGISEVEVVQELQEILWTLLNQRLDNLQLINNAIILIADDLQDPDAFEFAPGEKWLVPRPVDQSVQMWSPNPQVAQFSLEAESLIKTDIQNITGGMPFLGGTNNMQIDQSTATGVSIVSSLAQRRLAAKKQLFLMADARMAEQWIQLNQQFMTEPRYVSIVGADAREEWKLIDPEGFRELSFYIDVEAMDESMIRQERRAEAQAKFQVALTAVPVFAALAQADPNAPKLNMKAFMDDYLEAMDISDTSRYYSVQQQQQLPGPGGGVGSPEQNGGVSAPQATDVNSPSNSFSQSPVAALQRMAAGTGRNS